MTTLYATALRNFRAAADLLETLQSSRHNLTADARSALIGRPRLSLNSGYNDVTAKLGICRPAGGRAELVAAGNATSVELRCTGLDWLTLEGNLARAAGATCCHVEMQIDCDQPLIADIFLREFLAGGEVRDSGHRECSLHPGVVSLCRLALPAESADQDGLRVIIHLRQPVARMILDAASVTLT